HLMIVDSRDMEKGTGKLIDEKKVSAEAAVVEYLEFQASRFESLPDSYMRERAHDFRDIGERILRDLTHSKNENIPASADGEPLILVAREIGVSFVTAVEGEVGGIVLEKGGETSHAIIIAKSLGIPVVVGIDNIVNLVHPGEDMIVDGRSGFIFTNPDQVLKDEYLAMHERAVKLRHFIETEAVKSTATGLDVEITANVGIPADVEVAKRYGIKSAGLFRTEFAFARFKKWPSVRSQLKIYKEISGNFEGEVTIRTLDVGSDKILSYLKMPKEENPLLGLRSIRFSMEYLDLFRDQVKSILLAAKKGGNFKILLPMVSNVWEVETAAQIIEELSAEVSLHRHDIPKLGIMMEVPALAYQFGDYADLIDFVSIGTNDLIQYLLAVDRNSNAVGHLYSAFHPSVVRMLDFTREQVTSSGKELNICGEIAGVPSGTLLILALGYRHLSVSPLRFPYVKFLSDRLSEQMLEEIRSHVLLLKKESDIERYLKDVVNSINPMLLEAE
ncbi:MAG: phosphoenolpyruvate--protein phosphotransferase, partial [Candidatus Dadabacteria bacterium]|nr:phosphoenolpyruvate--protein phosphotransferase [Candidatus Dadabacteria bacterium]